MLGVGDDWGRNGLTEGVFVKTAISTFRVGSITIPLPLGYRRLILSALSGEHRAFISPLWEGGWWLMAAVCRLEAGVQMPVLTSRKSKRRFPS